MLAHKQGIQWNLEGLEIAACEGAVHLSETLTLP